MKRYNRPDKSSFSYRFILGLFIFSALMGAAFMVYGLLHLSTDRWLFQVFSVWTVFFGVTAYCWTDEERYNKYEYVMTPILFGMLFLLIVAFMIGGFYVLVPKIASGEEVAMNIAALIIAEVSLGAFAYITYHYFLRDYIVRKK